ncbi:MAG: CBS domain-containing protein [Desulfovibrio sp.]|jgi:tRNA nucleotidyltransferase (CCA-adding enzyme)|nr:CBS domain-containing protein [Desulfovibrio sp.]
MPDLLRPACVITAHVNADYDALASMVAAGKLYPDAVLLAPPTMERRSHPFTDNLTTMFAMHKPGECDLSAVRLLVLTDTRQRQRLEHIAPLFEGGRPEIHVYDHHPASDRDIEADYRVIKDWGATTSILTHLIMERGTPLTPDEATMLGLGIYEDTGSFTFTSTTEHDFTAGAFLRGRGMNMRIIAELTGEDMTRKQIQALGTMIAGAEVHSIRGIPVTVAEIALDGFLEDLASLVNKFMEIERLNVVFTLASMDGKVYLIARSRLPEVNVGRICSSFGGGGHASAASAVVKDRTPAELRAALLALLTSIIIPQMTVGRHMSSPAVTISDRMSIGQAEDLMNRYGLKAVPVLSADGSGGMGLIEQQTASRACAHKLGDQPVTEYMQRNIVALTPDSGLYEAVDIILTQRQRLVPVLRNDAVVGVLTRTDVIRLLVDDSLRIPEGAPLAREHRESSIAQMLEERLPGEIFALLRKAGSLGDKLGMSVFAVGGFVRDLLMGNPNLDIDLSVEGDGIRFAELLAAELGGKARPHRKFKTAVVSCKDARGAERRLDVATARLEYYEYPGALPTVELSSIKMDLYRRDFTINALAVQLNAARFGTLIDPFGARRDMKERTLAVLHSLSFIEDPTRILRAVRFERRFNLRIGAQTERLIKNALSLGMPAKLSGARLFHELCNVFEEKDVPACIRRLDNWGLPASIHPLLRLTQQKARLLAAVDEVLSWYRHLYKDYAPVVRQPYLLAFCSGASRPETAELLERLAFTGKQAGEFLHMREQLRTLSSELAALRRTGDPAPGVLYEMLSPAPVEGLLYLMAKYGQHNSLGRDISFYLTALSGARADIDGRDILAMGEKPGPFVGEILRRVLAAKLNGYAVSREDQLRLAWQYVCARRAGDDTVPQLDEILRGRT